MNVNDSIEGFKLLEKKELKDIDSQGFLFYHEKTGAKLLYLKNEDDNKVFSISFRTPPNDDTGVPHILEHSVLCGSRKYPVKEPFVELIKGSLNTFLNAMTFPDKTMYPLASKNEKDFENLMDVYLDAVFYPNLHCTPEILMQEGWHYHLENENDPLFYKGVVYNEMKGAFSSPESVLMRKIQESLFPHTIYRFESGGDPDRIPTLTQQEFTSFHKKYYHPSNSYIYLYGNMDLDNKLKLINNYLNNFEKATIDSSINFELPFSNRLEKEIEYPISKTEDEKDKTYLSLNFVISKATNPEAYLAFDILENILLESQSSPLRKALLKENIGKDVFGFYDNSILQPVFSIVVKNSNIDKKQAFEKTIFDTLQDLVKNGIDKKLIEASINRLEFDLREASYQGYPKGLVYSMKTMNSWLYDASPFVHLEFTNTLNKIKTALTTNYFENLIEKYLLNNSHNSLLIVKPKQGLTEEKEKNLNEHLQEFKSSLSKTELQTIIENTKKLSKRQTSPDSEEDLKKIPMLSLKDINESPQKLPLVEKEETNIKVLHHPTFTGGIGYLNLYFDMSTLPYDLIPYSSFLGFLLSNINTENFNYEDLSNEIDINTGGMSFNSAAYSENSSPSKFYPKFVVRSKALIDKLPKLVELLCEILSKTKFDDKNKIMELLQMAKSRLEMSMYDRGHLVASKRLCSYFSPSTRYNEMLNGLCFYKFLCNVEKDFDKNYDTIIENLKKTLNILFNKNNLIVSFTSTEEDYEKLKPLLNNLFCCLNDESLPSIDLDLKEEKLNEGIMTPAKVQYVTKGFNFLKLGYQYTGHLKVLKTILSYDYLWNKVRVQGGAYGCFSFFERNGNMFLASYRDPNLKDTLDAYDNIVDYIQNFEADEREITKYIIGTISEEDIPLTPSNKGEVAATNYIRHIPYNSIQEEREEILKTTAEDIRSLAPLIDSCLKQNCLCVLGNEGKINENKSLFNNKINLFE